MATLLLYGANGYTARLITRLAPDYGIRPVLAGRHRAVVAGLAHERGLDYRSVSLDADAAALDLVLAGVSAVLNCAGPFVHTAAPLTGACIRNGVHYIDITGEIEVFEQLHARDAEARAAGVMLLPGAGFDVVPSDCLAAHLKRRLPSATHLSLAITSTGTLSRGTASTMVEHGGRGGLIRRDGKLTRVRLGAHRRAIDFGFGPREAITIPWGDVATAFYSTGIPNVEVFSVPPAGLRRVVRVARYFTPLLRLQPLKRILLARIRSGPPGPDEHELRTASSYVWGEVVDNDGNFAEARCVCPNGYLLTAHTALLIARRVLAGNYAPGFQTPSLVYGPDLILEAPGVVRTDI